MSPPATSLALNLVLEEHRGTNDLFTLILDVLYDILACKPSAAVPPLLPVWLPLDDLAWPCELLADFSARILILLMNFEMKLIRRSSAR